jgi:opacity protein-like surface antigen
MTVGYTYHLNGGTLGPYLLAGLGAKRFEASFDNPKLVSGQASADDAILTSNRFIADTGTQLAWVVGAGYHFIQPVGATIRCVGTQAMGHTLTTLEAGISVRF